jgi:hypothetical protein
MVRKTVVLAALVVSFGAMPPRAVAEDSDPPAQAARLSYAQGQVAMQPAGAEAWGAATLNQPLTTGDKLWSDQNSRAEIQLGSAAVRLADATGFSLLNADDGILQMQVSAGTIEVYLPQLEDGQNVEIDTPNLALSLLQSGTYRVEVNDAGDVTVVKVSAGAARVTGAGQTFEVNAQQSAAFTSTGGLTADVTTLGAPDDFDQWCLERDQREESADQISGQYVSSDVTGYQDLDDYGSWQAVPDYGEVWVPAAVSVGWAPYRYGHWVWVGPWGWSWVDDAPWGFAPFHYGRWALVAGSWCWVPGPRHAPTIYAPALVGWVGASHSSPIMPTGGFSGVAWFPLAPHEAYIPAYAASQRYLRGLNPPNATATTSTRYANRTAPGAVTAVATSTFISAQPVAPHALHLSTSELALSSVSALAPAVSPTRASIAGSAVSLRGPPPALQGRGIVARTAPPRAPVPIERQLEAIRANAGRPPSAAQLAPLRPQAAAIPFRSAASAAVGVRTLPPRSRDQQNTIEHVPESEPASAPAAFAPAVRTDRPPAASAGSAPRDFTPAPSAAAPAHVDRPPALAAKPIGTPAEVHPSAPPHAPETHPERVPPARERPEPNSPRN